MCKPLRLTSFWLGRHDLSGLTIDHLPRLIEKWVTSDDANFAYHLAGIRGVENAMNPPHGWTLHADYGDVLM